MYLQKDNIQSSKESNVMHSYQHKTPRFLINI